MSAAVVDWGEDLLPLTETVSVLRGEANGAYPSGNSVVIRGAAESVIIDPSVTVVAKGGAPVPIDAVLNSHGHEDHMPGNTLFDHARVQIHREDLAAARSLEGLLDVYGFEGQTRVDFGAQIVEEFAYQGRPDATAFEDGHVWDLGGGVQVEAMHLPGHTRGHSGFVTDGVFFLSDIDLTGFGPYYGDAWSDLEQFEDSLKRAREVDADWYVTFHHKGVIEGRARFLEMIDAFTEVIHSRHSRMLEFLAEPRRVDDLVAHRFVYRPHVDTVFADAVEQRTAELHLKRMFDRGEAVEVEPGLFQRR